MIIFLYGQDSYRLKENLDKIIGEYKKKYSGLAFSMLDLGEMGGLAKLEDAVKTVSFFNEKRLVVVKDAFDEASRVAELIKTWDLDTDKQRILVFVQDSEGAQLTKKDEKLFAILTAKPNLVKALEPLTGGKLENWVVKEARMSGCEIEKNGLRKLLDYIIDPGQKEPGPSNSWHLKRELEKLINYKSAQATRLITASDVELLVTPRVDLNIFQLVDAFASRNKPQALALLHRHLESGEDPYYIFSMVVYQFRNLLRVKDLIKNATPYPAILKKTGYNPYVVRKTFDQSKRFEIDELKKIFAQLAYLDIEAKNGEIDMADGLYRFVFFL